MRVRLWVLALALSVATSGLALAQVGSGSIAGTVTDPQGGVLPGVTVTLTSTDRTATFVTEEDGRFRFLALPPGMYTVTATLQGFTTIQHDQIEVRIGQSVDIPLQLRLAAVSEPIEVILRTVGMMQMLKMYPTDQEALASF